MNIIGLNFEFLLVLNHDVTWDYPKMGVLIKKYSLLDTQFVEDYDVDVRNIRNGVVDIRNNVVVKCCK